jgi:hypothetical protein
LAEDDGALCAVLLSTEMTLSCTVVVAVPDGSSAEEMLGHWPDQSPIEPLFAAVPLCGLIVYQLPSFHSDAAVCGHAWQ